MQPKTIVEQAKAAADDKKAYDPVILDIAKLTSIAHYFLIVHGNSNRQVVAIAEHIVDTLKKKKVRAFHVEGVSEGKWVLIDFGTVIVHVFHKDTRDFYALERLWGEARQVNHD